MSEREESDQLPEEGPESQVPDDDRGADREAADKNAGARDDAGADDDQATGNPANAGEED